MLKTVDICPSIKVRDIAALLEQPPLVIRVNKFDEEADKLFSEEMSKAHSSGQQVIPVFVDSYGGQVYTLLSMLETVRTSRVPVATVCSGKAMSCGAILFGMGTRGMRFASRDATFLLHDVSSCEWGKVEEIKAGAKECERLNVMIYTKLALHCGKERKYFLDYIHNNSHADYMISAKEAMRMGLVDRIGIPELRTSVEVTTALDLGKREGK
jgi:ATP-dependent Clp protease protease subunit